MRTTACLLGLAALAWSGAAAADTAADIGALEARWGQAFLTGDHRFLQRLLAPEFVLMRANPDGTALFTPRAQWFAALGGYRFHDYRVRTTRVVQAGNVAIATVEGGWKVSMAGRGTREERFILSDTFVRRGGVWRVVYRHSSPYPLTAGGERR